MMMMIEKFVILGFRDPGSGLGLQNGRCFGIRSILYFMHEDVL